MRRIEELKQWFKDRELPKEMQIDKCAKTNDLSFTIKCLFEQAEAVGDNPKMQGYLRLLERIKSNLENE